MHETDKELVGTTILTFSMRKFSKLRSDDDEVVDGLVVGVDAADCVPENRIS